MVRVTSVLTPRLSRLIVDADLDMKNYKILNAVLGSGNKLGADLDAQNYRILNALLGVGTKLGADLDAQNYKILNVQLGGGSKLGADLDARNYRILNAVLGGGSRLGADLDAQNNRILNAALSEARLLGNLDAQGNKILNLTVDDQNLTSAVNMAALLDAIYPSISYDKYLCWDSEQLPPLLISGYLTGRRRILNPKPDYGVLIRANVVETANTIVYYYDLRHSHDLDTQDMTEYFTTSTTPTSVLSYDYGSVLSVKELYLIVSLWAAGGTGTLSVQGSVDGSTWTEIRSQSTTSTSETTYRLIIRNVSFRYLRFALANSAGYRTYAKIQKIVITI